MSFISGIGSDVAHGIADAAGGEIGDAVGRGAVDVARSIAGGGESGPEQGVGLEEPPDDFDSGDDGGFGDDGSGATGSIQGQSDGITQDANSGVASNQATSSAQSAQQDQNSLNSAANAHQTNEQNAAAANAQQAVADESNQDEEQAQLNAALEKARDEEIKAAIGSMQ